MKFIRSYPNKNSFDCSTLIEIYSIKKPKVSLTLSIELNSQKYFKWIHLLKNWVIHEELRNNFCQSSRRKLKLILFDKLHRLSSFKTLEPNQYDLILTEKSLHLYVGNAPHLNLQHGWVNLHNEAGDPSS